MYVQKKDSDKKRILGLASDFVHFAFTAVGGRARRPAETAYEGKSERTKKRILGMAWDLSFYIQTGLGPMAGPVTPFGPETMVFARFYKGFWHFGDHLG